MSIAQPFVIYATRARDIVCTVTLSTPTDVSAWTTSAKLRAYSNGPVLGTGTVAVTDAGAGVFTITWPAAVNDLEPGSYEWYFERTNAGFAFDIVERSAYVIGPAGDKANPTLTNYSEVLALAGLGQSLSDAETRFYALMIPAASRLLQDICNREFVYRASVTEYLAGTGTADLILPRTPVDPTTLAVYEDYVGNGGTTAGSFDATSVLTAGVDYYMPVSTLRNDGLSYSGIVKRLGVTWPYQMVRPPGLLGYQRQPLPGSVKAVYTGGYTLIPEDIKLAVAEIIADRRQARTRGVGFQSQSGEGYSYSLADAASEAAKLGSVRSVVNKYRRLVM